MQLYVTLYNVTRHIKLNVSRLYHEYSDRTAKAQSGICDFCVIFLVFLVRTQDVGFSSFLLKLHLLTFLKYICTYSTSTIYTYDSFIACLRRKYLVLENEKKIGIDVERGTSNRRIVDVVSALQIGR